MKLRSEGTCAESQPDDIGMIGHQEGMYVMYCVHKDLEDLDFLPRAIVEEVGFCSDCDMTMEAIKSRIVGGSQCQGHPDRVHVTVWFHFSLEDTLRFQLLQCAKPLTDEDRALLIGRTRYECLEADTWIGEGPYLEGLENAPDPDYFEETDDDFNVDDLLAEIALLLSGDEPQD